LAYGCQENKNKKAKFGQKLFRKTQFSKSQTLTNTNWLMIEISRNVLLKGQMAILVLAVFVFFNPGEN
jgi:hypothetical protein